MMFFKNSLQPGQRFYIACLLLALFACGLRFSDVSRVGFPVHDARVADLEAHSTIAGGLHRYFEFGWSYATGQARIGFLFSYSLFIAPYLFDGEARPIVITSVQLLTYGLFCLFLAHYLGVPAAAMIFLTLVCFVPHPGQHYPITSDPLVFHTPIALFFLGYNLHLAAKGKQLRPVGRWTIRGATFFFVLAAACVYEALYAALIVVEAVAVYSLLRDTRQSGKPRPIRRVLFAEAPVLGALTLFGFAYVVFRHFHPSAYSGTDLSGGPFRFSAFLKADYIYAISGLPGANLFYGLGPQYANQVPGGWATVLPRMFGGQELVLAIGVTMVFWTYIRYSPQLYKNENAIGWKWLPDFRKTGSRSRTALQVAGVALVISFVAQMPLSIVPRYQASTATMAPYVPSFFAFVCFSVAVPALLLAAGGWLRTRRIVTVVCVAAAALLAVVNREASELVIAQQERGYAGSRLINLFMKSKPFTTIPEGAVVVAPNLWDDIAPQWHLYEVYWTEYIRWHSGRHFRVVPVLPELSQIPHVPGQMFYLEKQGAGTSGEPVLVMSDLFLADATGPAGLRGRSIAVISAKPLNQAGMVFQQASESLADLVGQVPIGIPEGTPLNTQSDGHSFFATVEVPDTFLPGTAYVVAGTAATSSNKLAAFKRSSYVPMRDTDASAVLGLEFGKGFSVLESDGSHKWHWNDGASGQGTLIVWNRLNRPLVGEFAACIETGYHERSKLELEFRGNQEVVPEGENRCPLRRRWSFAPGENDIVIHSYARKLISGSDPRYLVFSVWDWKLTPVVY